MTPIKRIGILFGWIAGCICLSALCAAAGPSDWLTDFDLAKKEAAEKKRPILADFTGSDWCGWCIKLDQEVFSTKEFLDFAKKHLILFQADFPSRKELPAATIKQNEELAQTYGIEGFPTVLLLNATGQVIARTGYQSGGATAYVAHVKELLKQKLENK